MITLLAESKNMKILKSGKATTKIATLPCFLEEASVIADVFSNMSIEELAERYEVSIQLAAKAKRLFYEFHNPLLSTTALSAFTGEVFIGLDAPTLGVEEIEFAFRKVGIISSLYGYLWASDVINLYRFDYYVENPLTCEKMQDYWRQRITDVLIRFLLDRGEGEVLNLLPEAAAKCIDWDAIGKVADISKVFFKTIGENGKLKTPYSWKVKELRGKLLREILIGGIDRISDVMNIQTPLLYLDENSADPNSITFITF